MAFAIELYFDTALENQVLKVWNALFRRKLSTALVESGARPHVRLTLHSDLEPSKLRTALENFAQQQRPIPITLSAVGCLFSPPPSPPQPLLPDSTNGNAVNAVTTPNSTPRQGPVRPSAAPPSSRASGSPELRVFLAPVPSLALLTLHEGLQELLKRLSIPCLGDYTADNWQPTCPLAHTVPLGRLPDTLSALHAQLFPFSGHLCDIGLVEDAPAREHYCFPLGGNFA